MQFILQQVNYDTGWTKKSEKITEEFQEGEVNLSWTRWVVFIIWYDYFNPNLRYFRPIGVWYVHADCCVRKRELRNISLHNSYGCFYLTRSSKKAHKYRNIFYHEKDKNTVEIRCRKFWSSVHGKFFFFGGFHHFQFSSDRMA